ncbi:MAG: NTP transferase domain-containing protein [Myxococcales bacterium]|nr:NTP transferase domain-containing protein [Myxococcales bacterium]
MSVGETPAEDTFTLAVLAGGRGERLGGRVKPLAQLDGETLAERILRVLGPEAKETFLVAPARLTGRLAELALVVEDPGEGPGQAVYAAARLAQAPWLLVVAGDHVAPCPALLRRLWAQRQGVDAVVVRAEGRLQGTYALFRRDAVTALEAPGPRSLREIFSAVRVQEVPEDALSDEERAALQDVDTPEDAARFGISLPPPER